MNISIPSNILFLGMTGSGKTYCFKKLYNKYWKSKTDLTYLISPTAPYSGDYEGIIKDEFILSDMSNAKNKIIEIVEFCKQQKLKKKSFNAMLVIDDSIGVLNFNDDYFANMLATSRHINLTVVIMMQNLTKYLSPTLRNNLSYIFINRISDSNLECLYHLCGCWENRKDLKRFLTDNLVNYQTILIDKKDINNPPPLVFKA